MASKVVQLEDQYLVEASKEEHNYDKISLDKQWLYVPDQQQGSYTNGICVIDTTNSLGGNSGFAAGREAYVIANCPVTMINSGATNATAAVANFASLAPKAGIFNWIDRIDVTINGVNVSSGQPYGNQWNNLRAQCSNSVGALNKNAGTNMLYPDDTYSIQYSNSASKFGDGYSNGGWLTNGTPITTKTSAPLGLSNSGFFKRSMEASQVGGTSNGYGWASQATNSTQNCINNGKSYFIPGTSAAAGQTLGTWYFSNKIMLTDVHPVFETLDYSKNPSIRLTIYFQVGTATINVGASSATTLASSISLGGNTCPVVLASGDTGQPNASTLSSSSGTTVTVNWGVLTCPNSTISAGSFAFSTTRLYMPFYTLSPHIEKQLLEHPIKKRIFNDVYIQQFKNIATSQNTFSIAIQSTFANIQYIFMIPAYSGTNNFATATCEQALSPYDSNPFTTAPGCGIYNVQVQVGSQTVYKNLISYDWQSFCDEVSRLDAVNGNVNGTQFLGNGMIDQIKWTTGYKKWIFDVSRQSSDVRQNVTISGQLQSDQTTTFYVGIVYRNSFNQNIITGEITNLVKGS